METIKEQELRNNPSLRGELGAITIRRVEETLGTIALEVRANFCSSLPPVRFLFNLLIVYQIFDRLSRI